MNQLKKGIEDIRAIQLSDEEKRALRICIMSRPTPSPYRIWVRYSIAVLLIVVLLGGSVAFAAEQSVPGDLLYPIKVKVTEPARDLLAQTPALRAQWESQKASRRLEEAATLAGRNELTPERSADIEKRFQESARATTKALNTLARTEATSTIRDIEQEFDNTLAEHARTLPSFRAQERMATSTREHASNNEAASSSDEIRGRKNHDTSSLENTIKEVRKQFQGDESRARSGRDREEGKDN